MFSNNTIPTKVFMFFKVIFVNGTLLNAKIIKKENLAHIFA